MNNQENPIGSEVMKVGSGPSGASPTDVNAISALQKLPQDIAGIGQQFANIGGLNFVRGLALTNQMEVAKLMQALSPLINKLEKKQRKKPNDYAAIARLADSFSRLSFQVTQSQNVLLEIEKLSPSSKPGPQKQFVKSFLPGQIVSASYPSKSTPGV